MTMNPDKTAPVRHCLNPECGGTWAEHGAAPACPNCEGPSEPTGYTLSEVEERDAARIALDNAREALAECDRPPRSVTFWRVFCARNEHEILRREDRAPTVDEVQAVEECYECLRAGYEEDVSERVVSPPKTWQLPTPTMVDAVHLGAALAEVDRLTDEVSEAHAEAKHLHLCLDLIARLNELVAGYQSDLLEAETEKKELRNDRDHWRSISLENAVSAGKLGGEALVMKQELTRQLAVANMERAAAAVMIQRLARRLALAGGVPLDLPNEVAGNADNARMFLTAFGLSASGDKKEDPS